MLTCEQALELISAQLDGAPVQWGVIGQRFDASGNKLGGEFVVNETTAGSQYQPEITALSTGGFVVTFYNDNYDISGAGTTADVYIREYDASGVAIDGQRPRHHEDGKGGNRQAELLHQHDAKDNQDTVMFEQINEVGHGRYLTVKSPLQLHALRYGAE